MHVYTHIYRCVFTHIKRYKLRNHEYMYVEIWNRFNSEDCHKHRFHHTACELEEHLSNCICVSLIKRPKANDLQNRIEIAV